MERWGRPSGWRAGKRVREEDDRLNVGRSEEEDDRLKVGRSKKG
ncbi:hypothetical protein [Nodularia spumigena]|nr:hypothetical protein [Nodularia spumigena]MEA5616071.1 hypothetical protein [Nodularia spumigena UHCC 0040]